MSRIAAIQMNSRSDVQKNLDTAAGLIKQAAEMGAQVIVLPEMFAVMGALPRDKLKVRERFGHGPIQDFLAQQSLQNKVWLVGGTIPITSEDANKIYAACLIYNSQGMVVARYDKIHLFDASIDAGAEVYQESSDTVPGQQIVVVDSPVGKLGVAVCYDIRFPELFRTMLAQGAEVFAIPTAFTVKTGQAHWEVLTRARAIENLCYVVAACQTGTHDNGRKTYGHSIIIDPWGAVNGQLEGGEGIITAEIDLVVLHNNIRKNFPAHQHRKII